MTYGPRGAPGHRPRSPRRCTTSGFAYEDGPRSCAASTSTSSPDAWWPWSARPAAGKSTLTQLLTRLVDPDSGTVRIDGVDVRELTHGALTDAVAVVPQSTFLFDDSVRENVTLGEDLPDDDIWAALRTVQAEGFVSALPKGLDTQLGERGTTLSGGQRQRLPWPGPSCAGHACSSWTTPPARSTPRSSSASSRALAAHTSDADGPSVVVVAYRKATIALADEVVFLDDGRRGRPRHPRRADRPIRRLPRSSSTPTTTPGRPSHDHPTKLLARFNSC